MSKRAAAIGTALSLTAIFALAVGASASPLIVGPFGDSGKAIGLYSGDARNAENLAAALSCGAEGAALDLTIMGDDRNVAAAKAILDSDAGAETSIVAFHLAKGDIKANVISVKAQVDEMNGGWDLSVGLGGDDLLAGLAKAPATPLVFVVGKQRFDLAARPADHPKLVAFLKACESASQ